MMFAAVPHLFSKQPLPIRTLRKLGKFPKVYLSPKIAAGTISEKRLTMEKAKKRLVNVTLTNEMFSNSNNLAPEQFLLRIINSERSTEISKYFKNLVDLLSADQTELERVHGISGNEISTILKYAQKYKARVWPVKEVGQWKKSASLENCEWTEERDNELLELAAKYDTDFGNPWIYISYEMKVSIDQVKTRYFELRRKNDVDGASDEIILNLKKDFLWLNRDFRLIPPTLVLVPDVKSPDEKPLINDLWLSYLK
jgi:hypothetical protein